MPIINAAFFFFNSNQSIKHTTLLVRIMGNAKPIKEKSAVLCGDTYHARKDIKSRKIDTMVTVKKSSFINFLIMALLCFSYFLLASNS